MVDPRGQNEVINIRENGEYTELVSMGYFIVHYSLTFCICLSGEETPLKHGMGYRDEHETTYKPVVEDDRETPLKRVLEDEHEAPLEVFHNEENAEQPSACHDGSMDLDLTVHDWGNPVNQVVIDPSRALISDPQPKAMDYFDIMD